MTTRSPAPNVRLTELVADLPAGDALELGSGNGGDALWLAECGWNVATYDLSQSAVDRLNALARAAGVEHRIIAVQRDLNDGVPERQFDLVNAHYLHATRHLDRANLLRAAAQLLRPGGHLLVVDHGSAAPWMWNQDPDAYFPSPQQIYEELALDPGRWAIVRAEAQQRVAVARADVRPRSPTTF